MSFPYMLVANRGADSVSFIDLSEPGEPKKVGDDIAVGVGPRAVVLSPAHVGYVVNEGRAGTASGTVSVIDARDPKAVERGPDVTVGLLPRAVALSPAADCAYVVNRGAGTVSLLDIGSDPLNPTKTGADIPVGARPSAIAVDAVTGRAFVPNWGARTVSILSRTGGSAVATETIDVGDRPRAVAVHPSAAVAYVANWGSGTVSVIRSEQRSGPPAATVAVGSRPRSLAVHPAGDRLYVANYGSDTVTAVPLSPDTGLPAGNARSVPVGRNPAAVAFAPDGSFACTANHTAGSLSVIDPVTLTARQLPVGTAPIAVSFASDSSHAWVADQVAGALIAVYCGGPRVVDRTPVGTAALSVAVAPNSERLLVTDDERRVTPVTLPGLTAGTPLDLGDGAEPRGVAYAPDGSLAYVTAAGTDDVRVLDPGAAKEEETIPLDAGAAPRGIAVTPDGRYVCAADSGRDTLSVIGAGAERMGQLTDKQFRTPVGLAVAPLDGRSVLYVTNFVSSEKADGTVSVLELDAAGSSVQRSRLISKEDGDFHQPHGIAVTADRSTLYVANYGSHRISVLDGTTCLLQKSFTKELKSPYGIWLAEDRKLLYVANSGDRSVTVFDTDTGEPHVIDGTAHGLAEPRGVAVHDGVLYVANAANQSVSVLVLTPDGRAVASVADPIRPDGAQGLTGMSVSRNGRTLFATDQKTQALFVLTLKGNRLQRQDTVDRAAGGFDAPHETLRSPDGGLLYTVNAGLESGAPAVSVLRERAYPVRLDAGTRPWGVSCTPDGAYAIVTGHGNDTVTAVDPAARTATGPLVLPTGSAPAGVACSPQGVLAYVAGQGTDDVTVLRRDPLPVGSGDRTVALPGPVRGLAVDPRGGQVYLTGDSQVYVTATPSVAAGPSAVALECEGSRLGGVAAHPTKPRVYVADRNLPGVRVIGVDDPDRPSDTPVRVPGVLPAGVAVHPSGTLLYLCDQAPESGGVRVFDLADEDAPRPLSGAGVTRLPAVTAMALHPSARYAYVACQDPARIGVLALGEDGRRLTLLSGHDIAVPGPIGALAVHRSGGYAYAAVTSPAGAVLVLDLVDPARPRISGRRDCPGATGVAFVRDGDTAYLAYGARLTTLALGQPVPDGAPIRLDPGAGPREVAVSPDGSEVYVTGQGNDTLYVIDAATRTVRYRMEGTKGPVGVAADPAGLKVYLTDSEPAPTPAAGDRPTPAAVDGPTSVAVVDTTSHAKQKTADTGVDPRAVHGPDAERN
ncbi:beta-propeller fold lactonase family protein [Kitasatospora griseola]|uniref:beta-propeller fold lactonase family protein n=1 Tax=Kitasatospora griseola TaxID=2064 RepID=UPI0036DC4ACF